MNFEEYTKFANENRACYLATTDGDQPHVRGFLMWFANEKGFYFHTGTSKDVCKQLKKNPKIEVCFFSRDAGLTGKMMRVTGKVEFIEDKELKERLFEERPFLKIYGTPDSPIVSMFRIYTGEAHFWTMENNLKESEIERIKF